jgi:hypothetical protein
MRRKPTFHALCTLIAGRAGRAVMAFCTGFISGMIMLWAPSLWITFISVQSFCTARIAHSSMVRSADAIFTCALSCSRRSRQSCESFVADPICCVRSLHSSHLRE